MLKVESIALVLVLLAAVVLSSGIARSSPLPIPLPLIQILLGVALALTTQMDLELQPDLFFLLFLPPLLFLDGWRISKASLFRDKGFILALALGLVVFTVLGLGLFLHWMIPSMPLSVAFALAAIVSPTDPIAVSAIAARVAIPSRLMHILEGESLLNDASGLVCMRFAVAAAMTGTFSLPKAAGTFLWVALGGLAIGIAVTWSVGRAKDWFSQHFGEESGSQILISLLIPFGAYLLAEELHCSGILAAVAAGITMSFVESGGRGLAMTRVRRNVVWDAVQFAANGIIFVLLGAQLPSIQTSAKAVVQSGHRWHGWILACTAGITAALLLLRFIWVWVSLRCMHFLAARKGNRSPMPSWRLTAATALAGARGAITLAGVLTLPLTLPGGAAFPDRELSIILAAGVILLSLLVATIGLPGVLRGLQLPPETQHDEEEDQARIAAAEAALQSITRVLSEKADGDEAASYAEVGARLLEIYRGRIATRSQTGAAADHARTNWSIEKALRLTGLEAERAEIYGLARQRKLEDQAAEKLIREIDLIEARYRVG